MSQISDNICITLAKEILKLVESQGSVSISHGYADGMWSVKVTKYSVELGGYAAEGMTHQFESAGLKLISKEPYDQESKFANPQEVLGYFSMTQLAELFEAGEYNLKNKMKR